MFVTREDTREEAEAPPAGISGRAPRYVGQERRSRISWITSAFNEIDIGILVLSEGSEVCYANRAALTELSRDHALKIVDHRILAREARDAAKLSHQLGREPCMPSGTSDPSERLAHSSPSLRALAARGIKRSYRKGYYLIEESDLGDSIYIITKGRVRVFSAGDDGREVTYGTYGAGEYVGEMSLDGGPRSASVVAIEPIDCVQITRQTLLQHLSESPEFAFELLAKVIRRARAATLSTRQMALNDVYGRLVLLLNSLSLPDAGGQSGHRLTQREIASNLGCSREMVGRILRDLEKGKYVARTDSELVVLRSLPARW